jgi:hypothetical protein
MTPDPRWVDILKLGGVPRLGLFVACGLFLLFRHWGWLPPAPDWVVLSAWIVLLICGSLVFVAEGLELLMLWLNRRDPSDN